MFLYKYFTKVFNYAYFNCNNTSYIDHVFISNHISDTVKSCNIVDSSDNVSDHHPLHTCIALCVPSSVVQGSNNCTRHDVARYPRLDWSNSVKCKMYHDSHTHYTVGGKCIYHQHIMSAGSTLREFDALQ